MKTVYYISNSSFSCLIAVDGQDLVDIIYTSADKTPKIGEVYLGRVARPVKGMGGVFVDAAGTHFFLRTKKPPAAGQNILVQVKTIGEDGKAPLVSDKLDLHSANLVLTPQRPGLSLSKQIKDETLRSRLFETFETHPAAALGLIVRTQAVDIDPTQLLEEADRLVNTWNDLTAIGTQGLVYTVNEACERAKILFGDANFVELKTLPDHVLEMLSNALAMPLTRNKTKLYIEATRAYISVDVNTQSEMGLQAGLEANLEAVTALPLALKLRGLGGQIIIDLAPMQHTHRKTLINRLNKSAKDAQIDLRFVGWTPLGNMECVLPRIREPLPSNFLSLVNI